MRQALSPVWAYCPIYPVDDELVPVIAPAVFLPDRWRGRVEEFFTWLATNTGAARSLLANFSNGVLMKAWRRWSAENPRGAMLERRDGRGVSPGKRLRPRRPSGGLGVRPAEAAGRSRGRIVVFQKKAAR
jgi:hypothetical protein